jgi:hypothetical protein
MDSTQEHGELNTNSNSSDNVVQPNSFDPQKLREEISKLVDERLSDPRTTQSLKDKAWSEMKKGKDFREIFREIQTMRDSGMTDKEIELEARLREVEESRIAPNNPGKVVESNQPDVVGLTVKALGLDYNDPEVLSVISKGNLEEQIRGLNNVVSRKRQTPNPALVAQSAGDGAKSNDLLSEYQQKASSLRGNIDALIDLKVEYRKQGLDIN